MYVLVCEELTNHINQKHEKSPFIKLFYLCYRNATVKSRSFICIDLEHFLLRLFTIKFFLLVIAVVNNSTSSHYSW